MMRKVLSKPTLCGDGEIVAHVTNVSGSGFAGIFMREDMSPGARMLQLMVDGFFLTRREYRPYPNNFAYASQFVTNGNNWLRISRSGNSFQMFQSLDGSNWQLIFSTYMIMPSCIKVGLMTKNNLPVGSVTGTFENVSVLGGAPNLAAPATGFAEAAISPSGEMSVYPNPAREELNIVLPEGISGSGEVMLMDNFGKLVYSMKLDDVRYQYFTVQLEENLAAGTYMLLVRTDEDRFVEKVVISK